MIKDYSTPYRLERNQEPDGILEQPFQANFKVTYRSDYAWIIPEYSL